MHLYKMKMYMAYTFSNDMLSLLKTKMLVLSRILADFNILVKLQNLEKFAQANILYKGETNRMVLIFLF